MSLRTSVRPEFDAWRWNQYWVELDSVVEFKRQVYQQALTELARLLNRAPFDGNGYGGSGREQVAIAPPKQGE